jgi:hypothetical protein
MALSCGSSFRWIAYLLEIRWASCLICGTDASIYRAAVGVVWDLVRGSCLNSRVPNIVLQKCYDLIADHLLFIYQAILEFDEFYDPWREFTTVVLRKPDKPNYEVPKAYRPVALISTMAKVLTALVAENISRLVEIHQLLPKTHFGGRPGRTTTDAIHYLVHKIKQAWANNQVASVLFLDVEGAFPNAVTDRLIHNLKARRIPEVYTKFVKTLLTNRRTRLIFARSGREGSTS